MQQKNLSEIIELDLKEFEEKYYKYFAEAGYEKGLWPSMISFLKSKLTLIAETTKESIKLEKLPESYGIHTRDRYCYSTTELKIINNKAHNIAVDTQLFNWNNFNQ